MGLNGMGFHSGLGRQAGFPSATLLCILSLLFFVGLTGPVGAVAQSDPVAEECLACHDDADMTADDGRPVGVPAQYYLRNPHGELSCLDCHDSGADYEDIPHGEPYVPVNCLECHDDVPEVFLGSVHEDFLRDGDMTCATCHVAHQRNEQRVRFDTGCGTCHEDAAADYLQSVHRVGRRRNGKGAADCASCHGGHHVVEVASEDSPVHPKNIPNLCGGCHAADAEVRKDFVRLPIAVPNYLASVHGIGWIEGKRTAVCTDCHGTHDSRVAQDPESHINRYNVAETCGQCHPKIAEEYGNSIHGRATELGIEDSPTCVDCHDEHLIKRPFDPAARVSPEHRARELCGDCHTNPDLAAKYGMRSGVVETYLDSYHGWAIDRGSELVATCTDCHEVHEIRSPHDPASSVNRANVTATCAKCHEGANETFAHSYTHMSALEARGPQGWVRLFYLWLIAVVLGGMAVHNLIVARYELKRHLRKVRGEPRVLRWQRAERWQHLVLLASFTCLAITGLALRYPDAFWVRLIGLGGHESVRANLHRVFAIILVAAALYHIAWVFATRRGRHSLGSIVPRAEDVGHAWQNMAFHLGWRKNRPAFRQFDYTQKAEYWAVVWGTWVMAITGFILWYPTTATEIAPAWIVRVAEVIHFYEAVLAVSAIVIWHLFYVIFVPSNYPMSTIWLDGRMPEEEWKEFHRADYEQAQSGPSTDERVSGGSGPAKGSKTEPKVGAANGTQARDG